MGENSWGCHMEKSSKQTLPIVCDAVSVFLLQRAETSEEARVY